MQSLRPVRRVAELGSLGREHIMRYFVSIALLFLGVSCASRPDVPLPKVTLFDDNPKARAAYLREYRFFYRAYLAGNRSIPPCGFGRDPITTAGEMGGGDGMQAAAQAELNRERTAR